MRYAVAWVPGMKSPGVQRYKCCKGGPRRKAVEAAKRKAFTAAGKRGRPKAIWGRKEEVIEKMKAAGVATDLIDKSISASPKAAPTAPAKAVQSKPVPAKTAQGKTAVPKGSGSPGTAGKASGELGEEGFRYKPKKPGTPVDTKKFGSRLFWASRGPQGCGKSKDGKKYEKIGYICAVKSNISGVPIVDDAEAARKISEYVEQFESSGGRETPREVPDHLPTVSKGMNPNFKGPRKGDKAKKVWRKLLECSQGKGLQGSKKGSRAKPERDRMQRSCKLAVDRMKRKFPSRSGNGINCGGKRYKGCLAELKKLRYLWAKVQTTGGDEPMGPGKNLNPPVGQSRGENPDQRWSGVRGEGPWKPRQPKINRKPRKKGRDFPWVDPETDPKDLDVGDLI